MSRKKTQAVTERKMDSSKIKMDSSLLLLLLNNIPPMDGSCYKEIEQGGLNKKEIQLNLYNIFFYFHI